MLGVVIVAPLDPNTLKVCDKQTRSFSGSMDKNETIYQTDKQGVKFGPLKTQKKTATFALEWTMTSCFTLRSLQARDLQEWAVAELHRSFPANEGRSASLGFSVAM